MNLSDSHCTPSTLCSIEYPLLFDCWLTAHFNNTWLLVVNSAEKLSHITGNTENGKLHEVRSFPTPDTLKVASKVSVRLLLRRYSLSSGGFELIKICPVTLNAIPPKLTPLGVGVVGEITCCTATLATAVVGKGPFILYSPYSVALAGIYHKLPFPSKAQSP